MFLSKILLGFASLSLIAMASLPALADGASTRQTATQDNVLNGDGNRAVSRSRQRATVEQSSGSGVDTSATVQTVTQTTTINGDNNSSYNSSHQTATTRQGRR
jgi:hypothetical protein